jgi:surface protein
VDFCASKEELAALRVKFQQRAPLTNEELRVVVKHRTDAFLDCPLGQWNVSHVTDMSRLFAVDAFSTNVEEWLDTPETEFNEDISAWDVSSVTNMTDMFRFAFSFNQPLDSWDVSKVTTMDGMFQGAMRFNQPLGFWDVRKVTTMERMFSEATAFNQPLGSWDVRQVTTMERMFLDATAFNQPLGSWDVSKVTNLRACFRNADSFDQDLSAWPFHPRADVRGMLAYTHYNQPWFARLQPGVDLTSGPVVYHVLYGNRNYQHPIPDAFWHISGLERRYYWVACPYQKPGTLHRPFSWKTHAPVMCVDAGVAATALAVGWRIGRRICKR